MYFFYTSTPSISTFGVLKTIVENRVHHQILIYYHWNNLAYFTNIIHNIKAGSMRLCLCLKGIIFISYAQ